MGRPITGEKEGAELACRKPLTPDSSSYRPTPLGNTQEDRPEAATPTGDRLPGCSSGPLSNSEAIHSRLFGLTKIPTGD
jgi:hypothetical protein